MDADAERRLFELLDVLAAGLTAHRAETNAFRVEANAQFDAVRQEMRHGFDRVDRRLGRVELRIEDLEAFRSRVERRWRSGSETQNP